jgi:trans-2,3-dihydro-3-hydroxyanthranilate isomerase
MQQIAREFNFSETTFVFPPEKAGHTNKVRIFTPGAEVPFAGHPNIGTAFVLATTGRLGALDTALSVTFEERAGLVPITIRKRPDQSVWCELTAPERLSLGKTVDVETVGAMLSLTTDDIVTRTHLPQVASVGLPFLFVAVRDRAVLERVRVNREKLETLAADGIPSLVHVYTKSDDAASDIRARVFAPLFGVPEDPATGSANCALAGLLSHYAQHSQGMDNWRIAQGVELGRPSLLEARAEKREGVVTDTWIGGACVLVGEGWIEVGPIAPPDAQTSR